MNTDILYCGDDVRFIEPDTIKRLSDVAYADPKIGIVAARIQGLTPSLAIRALRVRIRQSGLSLTV